MEDKEKIAENKFQILLKLLEEAKYEAKNEFISIAKGKHSIPKTWKDIIRTAKRNK